MSTVIRKVIIETELRSKKSRLDAPDIGPAERAYKQETTLINQSNTAIEQHNTSVKNFSKTVNVSMASVVGRFNEGAESSLRMMRGIAFLSASGSEDMRKLAQTVLIAQGAFDTAFGAAKLARVAAGFGPVGIGIAGVTAVLGVGALAWRKWTGDVEEAAKATREARDALRDYEKEHSRIASRFSTSAQQQRAQIGDLRIRFAGPAERAAAIEAELTREMRERATFSTEQRAIERAGLRRRGTAFGETSPELEAALGRYGGFAGMKERRGTLLDQQEASLRRSMELTEERHRIDEDAIQHARRFQQQLLNIGVQGGAAAGFGYGAVAASAFSQQVNAGMESQVKEFNDRFRRMMGEMLKTLDDVQRQHDALKKQMEYGSAKR